MKKTWKKQRNRGTFGTSKKVCFRTSAFFFGQLTRCFPVFLHNHRAQRNHLSVYALTGFAAVHFTLSVCPGQRIHGPFGPWVIPLRGVTLHQSVWGIYIYIYTCIYIYTYIYTNTPQLGMVYYWFCHIKIFCTCSELERSTWLYKISGWASILTLMARTTMKMHLAATIWKKMRH